MEALAHLTGFELVARAVPDVEDFDLLMSLVGPVDDPINVRLVATKQVPEIFVFRSYRTAVRMSTQGANGISEAPVPGVCGLGGAIRRRCIQPPALQLFLSSFFKVLPEGFLNYREAASVLGIKTALSFAAW